MHTKKLRAGRLVPTALTVAMAALFAVNHQANASVDPGTASIQSLANSNLVLFGPVESISSADERIQVLGQSLHVAKSDGNVMVGELVAIYGVVRPDGTYQVSAVSKIGSSSYVPGATKLILKGLITSIDSAAGSLKIGNYSVVYSGALHSLSADTLTVGAVAVFSGLSFSHDSSLFADNGEVLEKTGGQVGGNAIQPDGQVGGNAVIRTNGQVGGNSLHSDGQVGGNAVIRINGQVGGNSLHSDGQVGGNAVVRTNGQVGGNSLHSNGQVGGNAVIRTNGQVGGNSLHSDGQVGGNAVIRINGQVGGNSLHSDGQVGGNAGIRINGQVGGNIIRSNGQVGGNIIRSNGQVGGNTVDPNGQVGGN